MNPWFRLILQPRISVSLQYFAMFNRPGVAQAVLQTSSSLNNSFIQSAFSSQSSRYHKSQNLSTQTIYGENNTLQKKKKKIREIPKQKVFFFKTYIKMIVKKSNNVVLSVLLLRYQVCFQKFTVCTTAPAPDLGSYENHCIDNNNMQDQ